MKKYEFLGGGQVMGTSNFEVVENMWQSSFDPNDTMEEYMQDVAKRARMQKGSEIRTDSVDSFVADLKEAGFLKEV